PLGFLVTANVAPSITSAAGTCGAALQFAGSTYFSYCAGSDPVYQIDLAGGTASFTDLGATGSRSGLSSSAGISLRAEHPTTQWVLSPLSPKFNVGGIVNAATFTEDLVPGGLFSIFGSGFVRSGRAATVQVNGVTARQVASSPFQI